MGCTESKRSGSELPAEEKQLQVQPAEEQHQKKQACVELPGLPDHSIGKVLGRGSYGVVYAAWDKQRKSECAVKAIDLEQTSIAEVEHEAHMLRTLQHPCVVGFRDVYFQESWTPSEGRSAFLVMDVHKGGSLLTGMMRHWRKNGSIPLPAVQNISKMMTQATEYLHRQGIVHRDLKSDNFLLNRNDIEHPECRVFLCDFGTACAVAPAQRLTQQAGTPTYWAPELYDKSYGLAVDAWALGVIVYGLIWENFPFMTKQDTKALELQYPAKMPDAVKSFVCGLLERDEDNRLTARKALEHSFLSVLSAAEVAEGGKGLTQSCSCTSMAGTCSTSASFSSTSPQEPLWQSSSFSSDSSYEPMQEVLSFVSTCSAEPLQDFISFKSV